METWSDGGCDGQAITPPGILAAGLRASADDVFAAVLRTSSAGVFAFVCDEEKRGETDSEHERI